MDDVHLLTARHFRYELRKNFRGGKIFSSKFGAREVCIAPQDVKDEKKSSMHDAVT